MHARHSNCIWWILPFKTGGFCSGILRYPTTCWPHLNNIYIFIYGSVLGGTPSSSSSSTTTWGSYHVGGGPLTRNTRTYIYIYVLIRFETLKGKQNHLHARHSNCIWSILLFKRVGFYSGMLPIPMVDCQWWINQQNLLHSGGGHPGQDYIYT